MSYPCPDVSVMYLVQSPDDAYNMPCEDTPTRAEFLWDTRASLASVWFCLDLHRTQHTVDCKKLEYGFRVIYAGFPSLFCVGIRGRSYSNFLASMGADVSKHQGS